MTGDARQHMPLIAHVVFRFDYGGLENGVTNIVNALAGEPYRHAVIALTEAGNFSERLHENVSLFELRKKPGKDIASYVRLFRLFRRLKPTIVHTRNIGTLDCAVVAFLAGVPVRLHGEHGWDVDDPDGSNRKHRLMRRVLGRFVRRFVAVSEELASWLTGTVGIPPDKVVHVCNGVDPDRFTPQPVPEVSECPFGNRGSDLVIIGSVTRFSEIKDPLNLVDAFIGLANKLRGSSPPVRLMMIGDGVLRREALRRLSDAGLADIAWLPGSRDDIPELLRLISVFVLGSYREGISNTILEAMSTGLPIVATDTGGNPELVQPGFNGTLVPPSDGTALEAALQTYASDPDLRWRHGQASRQRVMENFSINTMIDRYRILYQSAMATEGY